jgi:hypothetical protein
VFERKGERKQERKKQRNKEIKSRNTHIKEDLSIGIREAILSFLFSFEASVS